MTVEAMIPADKALSDRRNVRCRFDLFIYTPLKIPGEFSAD